MNKNIKVAKELVKLAKNLIALDEEGNESGFQMMQEQERLDRAQKEGKKYILHHKEGKLWRIQACKNFGYVKKGEFGGLIGSEKNLSHDGDCWVYDDAQVLNNAQVYGNALVYDNANVFGDANVFGKACVYDNAKIYGNAKVYGYAQVYDYANVYGYAQVYDFANVYGKTKIHGKAKVDYDVKDQEITK